MKFLVVGLGSMGKRRIRNLQHLDAGEIIGLDFREDRRQEVESTYSITTFPEFEQAMAANPDALVISTPPDQHLAYAREAALRGKYFFSETSVLDEDDMSMDELIELCRDKPIVAAPSCTMRFNPSVRTIKRLIDEGAIGKVLTFTYHSGHFVGNWHPWDDLRTFYAAQRKTGACREIFAFELLWLTWLFGSVQTVSCFKDKLLSLDIDIDDVYQTLLQFSSGTIGHVLVDAVAQVPYRVSRFLGESGVIEWTWADKTVRLYRSDAKEWSEYPEQEGTYAPGYIRSEEPYIEEMRHFLSAIRDEDKYMFSFSEEAKLLQLLHAFEESSTTGKHVSIS